MLAQIASDSSAYKTLLVLHILCAIIGFGTVFFNGIYGAQAKNRPGPEGLAITQANLLVSRIGEYFIYAVFVFGVLMVLFSPYDRYDFETTFVWVSMLLYLIGIAISHAVLWPNVRKMTALSAELVAMGPPPAEMAPGATPPPQVMEIEERAKRVALADNVLKVLLVAVLVLMVWKPL